MRHKILIVEDDRDTRTALTLRLRSAGFEAVAATDGVEAISTAVRERPHLVLLDLGLPAGDGFTVLERFRNLDATSSVPIVVCSARDAATTRERAIRAGAVAYLQKPFENEILLATIRAGLPFGVATGESPALRVLIIEDDQDARRGLAMRLNGSGFETTMAADAVTGFAAAIKHLPDAVVMDLGLPGGDGLALIERMRSYSKLAHVPIVVLSARPAATERRKALQAGAAAYFEKPADNRALINALRQAVRGVTPAD